MTIKHRNATAILFVDDETMSTKWFEKTFGDEFTIHTANSAESANVMLQLYAKDIAVLVTDYQMPGTNGLELLESVNEAHPWIVKIMVTAFADKDLVMDAVNKQLVYRVLEKPWDDKLLRRTLKAAVTAYQRDIGSRDHIENSIAGMRDSLGFIAQEMSSPLRVINSCINMIQNTFQTAKLNKQLPAEFNEILPALKTSQRNILACQNLMDGFSQSTNTAFASIEASPILASRLVYLLLTEIELPTDKKNSILIEVKDDFSIGTKQNLIFLCLTNILQNAVEAIEQTSRKHAIKIEVRNVSVGKIATAHSIRITDNGPGLPVTVQDKLLSTRSASNDQETGFGLIVCKKIIQSLGGSLGFDTTATGTTMILQFPLNTKDSV